MWLLAVVEKSEVYYGDIVYRIDMGPLKSKVIGMDGEYI